MLRRCFANGISNLCRTFASPYHVGDHFERDSNGKITGTIEKDESKLYDALKERLDLSLLPYPRHEFLEKMIRTIFTPEDCEIISHMNSTPTVFSTMAKRLGLTHEEAEEIIADSVHRGLLYDIEMGNYRYLLFPEYAIGWYELTIRYISDNEGNLEKFNSESEIDWPELMNYYEKFWNMVAPYYDYHRDGVTTIMRAVPYDLPDTEPHYVTTYETARGLIQDSPKVGLFTCVCKYHVTSERGEELPEDVPMEACILANDGVDAFVKVGYGREVSHQEALDVLEHCHDRNHMTHVDNSKSPFIICNCHQDYCGILRNYYECGHWPSHPSKFLPVFNTSKCIGCGICVDRCVANVLELVPNPARENLELQDEDSKKKKKRLPKKIVQFNNEEDRCIGCLSCQYGCKIDGAIDYVHRPDEEKYDAPDDFFEWFVRMAWDRSILHTLAFDRPPQVSRLHTFLRKVGGKVENGGAVQGVKEKIKGSKMEEVMIRNMARGARIYFAGWNGAKERRKVGKM